MEGKKKVFGRKARIQSGNIHVYLRGNCRYNVFYDDKDRIEFLIRCNNVAHKYDTKILAFVLMDNHVHLQLVTNNLTNFVSDLLKGYVQWYNRKNGLSDKLFKTPFSSACKHSDKWIENSILYILNNPIKSGMCKYPSEYLWSSYHFHLNNKNPLRKYIKIDTDFLTKIYPNRKSLDKAIMYYKSDLEDIRDKRHDIWPRVTDGFVIKCLNTLLKGRNVFQISEGEMEELIISLRKESGASYRQIASVTHESYELVRRTLWRSLR